MNPIAAAYHRNLELEYQDRTRDDGYECPSIYCWLGEAEVKEEGTR